jgi:hypothetical protein
LQTDVISAGNPVVVKLHDAHFAHMLEAYLLKVDLCLLAI